MPDTTTLKIGKLNINSNLIAFAVILLITFASYWNSLQGDFIWDDKGLIVNHASYLKNWSNLFSVFIEPFFEETPFYRPFLIISFIIDYQFWGLQPFGFHYTNVLLHAMNAFMVYLLVAILFKHRYFALCSGLLFATHPIHTEAVAWISGRNDVLLTFFSLLTFIFYIRWQNLSKAKRLLAFIGFLASYGCVLLTKESGSSVFLLIILVDYFFQSSLPVRSGGKRKAYLAMILISFIYIYIRMNVLEGMGVGNSREDFASRVLGLFVVYAYYFKMLLFPIHQTANPFSPHLHSIKDPVFISSFFFIVSLALITFACWKKYRDIAFSILWIVISIFPVSGIVPLTVPALEHRLYLGAVGFSILISLLIYRVPYLKNHGHVFKKTKVMASVFILLMMLYCAKTVVRNTVWKNEKHFWLTTVKDSPVSASAYNNLGLVYAVNGQYRQAIREFEEALSLNIDNNSLTLTFNEAKVYCNLGRLYYNVFEKYLSVSGHAGSKGTDELIALVRKYGIEGIYNKGINNYKRALQLNPDNAATHHGLGELYYLNKSYQLAAEEYKLTIKLNPCYVNAYNNLGLIYLAEKHYVDAQEKFLKVLELKPDFAEAYNNLALAYFNRGLYQKALEEFNSALKLMPENGEVHFNLALVYLKGFKNRQKAVDFLRESLRIDPHHSRAAAIKKVLAKLKSDKVSGK